MSAVSGLTAKGEKGKSKYVALDINSLYKGKSLENPKATVLPKHGLQSLGKVGAGRRMPPPANLPSLKSENSGNNPNINLVPSGGQGWGTSTKEKGKTEETSATQQQSQQPPSTTSASQGLSSQKTPTTSSSTGPSKTWSSVTSSQEDGGQERSFLGHQSPFFPQEFPKLAGGDVQTEGNRKSSADSQYGPGPSLRPQTEGSWGRGTLQQQVPSSTSSQPSSSPQPTIQGQQGVSGGLPPNNGSGVNGQQNVLEPQVLVREQKSYPISSRGAPLPPNNLGTSNTGATGSATVVQGLGPTSGGGHGITGQMGPGSNVHPQLPQYRGMMPPYMYGRNFPGGYPNYTGVPPTRQPYPYPDNRIRNSMRPLAEEEAYQRPAAIITDKDLKGFDEILQNDSQDGWASVHGEIDYNAKLVFSDEEDNSSQKKDIRNHEDKNRLKESRNYEKDCEREHEQNREDRNRDADWEREDCANEKRERDVDWDGERREKDDRWRNWEQQHQGRPGPPLGTELQRQWQSQQQQQRVPFDYRGPPPRPQGGPGSGSYGSPHSHVGSVTTPQSQQHIGYSPPPPPPPPPPRTSRAGRPPSLTDDDEIWRQRRRQHSDEMTLAVERARQRREEEEKRYEQSKQTAQDKLKSFAEGGDKGFSFSRQFQKNVPPRFQKQAELLRQQHQQQPPSPQFLRQQQSPVSQQPPPPPPSVGIGVAYGPQWGNMPPPPPPPYINQMTGMTVPPKSSSGRSDSQGSGTDSYDSDRRTPEQSLQYDRDGHYWNRERRQPSGLAVAYDGWIPVAASNHYDKSVDAGHNCEQNSFKHNADKEDKQFLDASSQDSERRNREFDNQEYNCRDDQDHTYDERAQRETVKETESWNSSRDYGDRMPDPFDEPNESHSSQDKWERPQRPDSRDSRVSKESGREERTNAERQGSQSSLSDKDLKIPSREEKDRTGNIEWGDTPYPAEPKRHHEWHHPPPITQKQLESVGPTKKNFTPLRRNVTNTFISNSQDKKSESAREPIQDNSIKILEADIISKNTDKKEEKLQKQSVEPEKFDKEKAEKNLSDEKSKAKLQKDISENVDVPLENDVKAVRSPEKLEKDVKNEMRDKNDNFASKKRDDHQQRDKRQGGRDRGIGPRSRGGGRSESSRGRGRNSGYGPGNYGGRSREYRRSRVDKGPRFDKQHDTEWPKEKCKEKEKPSEESSASEVDDGKLDHIRQKDEDSEISVDDTSASTSESVQAEKRRLQDDVAKKEANTVFPSHSVCKDLETEKSEKKELPRKDTSKKPEMKVEERLKEERGGFYPRGEPSRRGRGSSVSLRNSRGGSRYGPSRYGPPPSRAAFGSGRSAKAEEPNIEEQAKEEEVKDNTKQDDVGTFVCNKTSSNKSVERLPPRRTRESLPPRFQKRQAKRYENSETTLRGRPHGGRGGGVFHSGNTPVNKAQSQKENLSDVANEEWETASESSDVAERRERKDLKEENMPQDKKEFRDNRNPYMKKSFSGQRPINDSTNRRPAFDSRRGRGSGENRQRETFGRETRRDSGRGRPGLGNDKRSFTGNNGAVGIGTARFGSNTGNQSSKNIGRNNGRGTQSQSKYNFAQKNEGSTAVFRIDEIRDSRGIQAALTDLANRNLKPSDVAPSSKPIKPEKEKSNALEGYDLNNYASVVIIDDQPEVTVEDPTFLCDADDGFQEVTSKKRHKTMLESDVKKIKKEPRSRNKSGSRLRQNRLPPRLAKQRENNQFHSKSGVQSGDNLWDSDIAPNNSNKHPVHFPLKDAAPAPPPPVNAWQKPIMLKPHSGVGSNSISEGTSSGSATCTAITSSTTTVITEIQALTVSSKSSSFDRSDQHDSGIDVSDQPTSAASSQRSSPSNDCKILGPKSTLTTVSVSSSEGCAELDVTTSGTNNLTAVRNELCKTETAEMDNAKAIQLPVTFSTKEPFGKGEEGSDMKLDFTYDSELARISEQKSTTTNSISHAMQVTSGTSVVGVQSPISPSADELNLKIASVKKVWENVSPMPTVLEHPPTGSNTSTEEGAHTDSSFSSFAANADHSSSLMSGAVDSSGQARKDSSNMDTPEVAFRTSPSMQQTGTNNLPVSLVPKGVMNIEQSVCKVKTQIQSHQSNQIPGCTGPVSPPPIGLDTTIGIRTLAGLASSVQMTGIPAVPSPPTVLFNSSQQMAQTGLYQHLPMDGSQVLTQQTRAVAAAIAQFSQPPHGYAAPLGTYGLSHQTASAQLSSAFGQQNMFMQTPPSAHQPQDLYSSNQYRVQPPYPQGQHVTSNQVLNVNAQQNLPTSHLLGSQLVQTRPTPGPATNPAGTPAPHLQGLHGIQAVQPAPSTSYYSTSAQGQNATSFYPQPAALTAPGSPMQQQQQPQFPSQQGFGSQSTLNVLTPGAPSVTQNFRGFGGHQFKGAGTVMSSIAGGTDTLRSNSHSPTMDSNMCARGVFTVGNTTSTTVNSGSVMTVPQLTSTGITTKIGQQQSAVCTTTGNARLTSTQRMTSQSPTVGGGKASHGLSQSSQQYYSFNQQKYSHVQAAPGVRPVLFQGVVRNSPHQAQYTGTTGTMHYPSPIQRPGGHGSTPQQSQPPQRAIGRTQIAGSKAAAQLTTAQQAKLRAEAVQQTHRFFNQTSGGKPKIDASGIDKSRTAIKATCPSNANLEETKGLKTGDISTTPVLSQDVDIQKVIENKDGKLEE